MRKKRRIYKSQIARLAAQTAKLKSERKDYKADDVVTAEERNYYRKDKKRVAEVLSPKYDGQTQQ